MLKMLNEEDSEQEPWLTAFWKGNSDPADSQEPSGLFIILEVHWDNLFCSLAL